MIAAIFGVRQSKSQIGVKTDRTLGRVITSLKLGAWQTYLANHPSEAFVNYLLRGIRLGFKIGCKSQAIQLKLSTVNNYVVRYTAHSSDFRVHRERGGTGQ